MKILTRKDLREQIRRREISPVYVLFGVETHLRDLAAETIAEFSLTKHELRAFNEHEIRLNETSKIKDAVSAAEQLPVGDERRVVRISNFHVSANSQTNSVKAEDELFFERYIENPSRNSVVIFVAEEFDKRLRISKLLAKHATVVEFEALTTGEAASWIRGQLREKEAEADNHAINMLIDLVGTDTRKLLSEGEKLVTAALPDKTITGDLVKQLVKSSRVLRNFDLTDQLFGANRENSLGIMRKILDDGAEPLMLLGLLAYYFRQLYLAKQFMDEGLSRPEIVERMRFRGNPSRLFEVARRTEPGKFEEILRRLAKTDVAIKTSVGNPRLQIEMLVCELVSG